MINSTTINKLHEMRLSAMAEAFNNQLTDGKNQELSFEERVGIMVDMEWARRKSNRLLRLMKKADFRYPHASIEDIEYHADVFVNQKVDHFGNRKIDHLEIKKLIPVPIKPLLAFPEAI